MIIYYHICEERFQFFLDLPPENWGRWFPFWRAYFSDGCFINHWLFTSLVWNQQKYLVSRCVLRGLFRPQFFFKGPRPTLIFLDIGEPPFSQTADDGKEGEGYKMGGNSARIKEAPKVFSREFRPEKLFPIPIGKQIRIWPNDGNQPFFERQVLTPVWFLRHFAGRLCMPGTRHFSATNQGTNLPLNLDGQLSTPPMMWNSPLSNSKLLWDWVFFFSANFSFALTKIGITSLDQFHLNTFSFPSIARSLCCLCRNLAGAQLSLGTIFFGAVVSTVWVHFNMMFQNFIPKYHVDSLRVSMHVYLYQTCLKRNVSRVMAWYKSRIPTISSLVQVVQVLLMVQKSGEKTSWSWGW